MASLKVKLIGVSIALIIVTVIGFFIYNAIVPHSYTTTLTAANPSPPVNGFITARGGQPA